VRSDLPTLFDRLDRATPELFVSARQEAKRLNQSYTGTEHVLLALLRSDEGAVTRELTEQPAAILLREAGVSAIAVERVVRAAEGETREQIQPTTKDGRAVTTANLPNDEELFEEPFTRELVEALVSAARRWSLVTPTHLLLAILEHENVAAVDALRKLDVSPDALAANLRERIKRDT
jgi:ATP-dependent Clp protease ATP-binding subunit ClpA